MAEVAGGPRGEAAGGRRQAAAAFRYINDGYAALPDGEAQKTDALVVQRTFKDFKFRVNDGYGAEADKILQMGQNLQTKQEFLTQIGAWQWYVKAAQAAQQVRYLLGERAKTKGEFVKGELNLHPAEGLRALRPRVLSAERQGRGRPRTRPRAAARTRRDARGAGGIGVAFGEKSYKSEQIEKKDSARFGKIWIISLRSRLRECPSDRNPTNLNK